MSNLKLAGMLVVLAAVITGVTVGAYLLLSGGGDGEKPSRPVDGKFSNSKLRYGFEYPTDWKDVTDLVKLKLPEGASVLEQNAVGDIETQNGVFSGALVSVVRINHEVKANDLPSELNDLDKVFQQQAETVKGRLQPPTDGELGGLPARQYVIEYVSAQGDLLASAQTVTFFGDRQYTVNCQGRSSNFSRDVLPGCEKLVQSFRFK